MRMNEIASAEEQLGLLRLIIDNTWTAIKQQADAEARQRASQPKPVKVKAVPKIKPAPMAAPPKPLPKPKPVLSSPLKVQEKFKKSQQGSVKQIGKELGNKTNAPMPKSLQPLPSNILSPIHSVDKDFQKKMEFARKQGEQNRLNNPNKSR